MTSLRLLAAGFRRDDCGSSAVEMALVTPMLLVLMLGSFELGKFFLDEHTLAKAMEDGARFASRQPFTEYTGCAPSSTVVQNTRNVSRTGQVASGGTPRLNYWTNQATITVSVTCDTTGTYSGIYKGGSLGAPVVTVSAAVPYTPLFARMGFSSVALTLRAQAQAAVSGV